MLFHSPHRRILASVALFLSSMRTQVVLVTTLCLIGLPALAATKNAAIKYPETRRVDQTDEFFGVKVPDPYRWLEADVHKSPEVAGWARKQNEITRTYLDAIPQRAAIEKRLTELWNFERYGLPGQ